MTALVLAQHDNAELAKATLHAVTAAGQLGGEVHLLVAGRAAAPWPPPPPRSPASPRCCMSMPPSWRNPVAEDLAALIVALAGAYDHLLGASTTPART